MLHSLSWLDGCSAVHWMLCIVWRLLCWMGTSFVSCWLDVLLRLEVASLDGYFFHCSLGGYLWALHVEINCFVWVLCLNASRGLLGLLLLRLPS